MAAHVSAPAPIRSAGKNFATSSRPASDPASYVPMQMRRASHSALLSDPATIPVHAAARPSPPPEEPLRGALLPLQRKLAIGSANDPLESEADRVADHVLRIADPAPGLVGPAQPALQRKAHSAITATEAPPIVHDVLRSSGQPLDAASRTFFESRFGVPMGGVRVHSDSQACASAGAIDALAYTSANHIVFGPGAYAPAGASGKKLLAHELTHVFQQGAGATTPILQRQPNPTGSGGPTMDPRHVGFMRQQLLAVAGQSA